MGNGRRARGNGHGIMGTGQWVRAMSNEHWSISTAKLAQGNGHGAMQTWFNEHRTIGIEDWSFPHAYIKKNFKQALIHVFSNFPSSFEALTPSLHTLQ